MTGCIVLGCTSGYRSNKEKLHFFSVPRDKKLRDMWQAALRRRNIIIKSSQAVCEKHFLHTDILWKREICDEKGNVLAHASISFDDISFKKENKDNAVHASISFDDISFEKENKDNAAHASISFDDIINILNKKQLRMPRNWTYAQCYNDMRLLAFFLPKCDKLENYKDEYTFNCLKEVFLQEDMTIRINILKQPVLNILLDRSDISVTPITNTVENIEELQELLFFVDNLKICPGINISMNEIEKLGYTKAYKDIYGTLRHRKCLFLVSLILSKCKFCSSVRNSLNQKRRRLKLIKCAKK
ncbi:hypothetical protein ALC57_10444 [Trachymyrmex cornetzi]|uniref:THAP-type domain-containing protein n=1 Tax=Trachymyrmex cornetzi TaxID=471704 RepID=A0A195DWD9_9HYME|nr:hypothetical protein ALC57_10444 [Trachymyrmex cornetzi]